MMPVSSKMTASGDSYAHSGALRAGKRTVAVLGSGLDTDYPPRSAPMRKQILATGGVVLTELEPSVPVRGMPGRGTDFPAACRHPSLCG